MSKYSIDNNTLIAIGDAIRTVEETTDSIPVVDIPDRILALEKPGAAKITLTGNLNGAFSSRCWNDDKLALIKTQDITDAKDLFSTEYDTTGIPFDLNFDSTLECVDIENMFYNCGKLKTLPKVNNCKPKNLIRLFTFCNNITSEEIKTFLDSLDYSYLNNNKQSNTTNEAFYYCYSLRAPAPIEIFNYCEPADLSNATQSIFYRAFNHCAALDEILNLKVCRNRSFGIGMFQDTFHDCYRLKNLTFETQADGTPYVVEWISQTIDLTSYIGYVANYGFGDSIDFSAYNTSITSSKKVSNDSTYAALKNDPDWYTSSPNYSRYNHDSAVNTINSLPDTSAFLSNYVGSAFSANTIKFKGSSGTKTDGGAINTLTEEEVAVAAAKGWTVALV